MLDHDAILERWARGEPPGLIAAELECSKSWIYTIARNARESGDGRGEFPSIRARQLYVAVLNAARCGELSRKGIEVSTIAAQFDLPEHIVRAAIYIATQNGQETGLKLGG